jgi:hypothetical protein
MNPNQPPQPPGSTENDKDTFWIRKMPYGPVAIPGPPPGSDAEPLKVAKQHVGEHHPDWVYGIPEPPSQPKQPPPQQQKQAPPPGFGMPPPWMAGMAPSTTQPQALAPQAKALEENLEKDEKNTTPGWQPDGRYRLPGMGPLAPLPQPRQDPNNPATLPSDYYAYHDIGNPAEPLMKWNGKKWS